MPGREVYVAPGIGDPDRGRCGRIVLAVFGGLFLIALLSVPVTTSTSEFRQDPGSRLIFRTTYPKNSTMFLPSFLAGRAHPGKAGEVRVRSAQWVGTMAIVAILGVFDHFVFCRLWRRRRRPGGEDEPDRRTSDLSLFP